MINWQAELRPGSSPEPHRHGRLWGEHQKPFITRLKRARVFGPIFGNIWFHETICCKVEKETAKKKRKVHLWNPKMPPLNELCRFGLCNLILATPPDKEKKKKKKKKKELLWKCECQDHGQRPNTQTKGFFVQGLRFMSVFQIIHWVSTVKKWQTAAARLSVQNIRQDKRPLSAKYSCKTGLFP